MQEEAYLELVLDKLHEKIAEIDGKISANQQDITNMHAYFWENYNEFDEYGYELYDNSVAFKSRMKEQEDYGLERRRYERMLDSPYFGRVDFCYEGEDEPETYYIGIGNLAKGRAKEPYVFDWRAPVSGLFYDYDKGPAQFEAPAGVLTGEITKKKQYKIKRGKLIYALENDMNIDDEILQQALSEHADASLKSIVTTIQKEQNKIIRDTSHRILAVQGCAGSGKTSVALHRIAYLLYHNRKNLTAAQVLILSPNQIFADYIARILPELGEENICEMTLDDYAYRELLPWGEAEDHYDEIEKELHRGEKKDYFYAKGLKPATKESAYKQSKAYVEELNGFILELEWDIVDIRDFQYKNLEMKEEKIAEFFYEKFADTPIFMRMQRIAEYLIDQQETLSGKTMPEEEQQNVFEKINRMYETRDLLTLYNRFLKQSGRKGMNTADHILRYEDVYPMLYLKYCCFGLPARRPVRHLVIDEMQDYSYLQYVLLAKMFDCPMTILGDKGQTMQEEKQDVLSFLPKIFGKDVCRIYLEKSYRSTSEIMDYASEIAGEKQNMGIGRHGSLPQTTQVTEKEEEYRIIAEELCQETEISDTIAILCLDADQANETADGIRRALAARGTELTVNYLTRDSQHFDRGISVMPFYLAKGLEFDAVYIPDLQQYQTPLHRQALYINVTRALHRLRLYECIDAGKQGQGD